MQIVEGIVIIVENLVISQKFVEIEEQLDREERLVTRKMRVI